MRLRACALVCLLAAPTAAQAQTAPAPAAAKTSSLGWLRLAGAEACVSTRDLARDVEARLHRAVFVSPSKADVSVEGHVAPLGGGTGWRARITMRDAEGAQLGTRELVRHERSCAGLREPLAFVIAVMIDPDAALRPEPAAEPPPVPPPAPPVAPLPVAPPPVTATSRKTPRPDPIRFDAGGAGVLGFGVLPHPALGVQVDGLLHFPHAPALEARGAVFPGSTESVPGGGGNQKSLAFGYVAGGICPLWYHGNRVHAYACAAGYVGLTHTVDTGPARSRDTSTYAFLAPAVEGRLTLRLAGPFSLRVGAAGLVPILRPHFRSADASGASVEVYRPAPLAALIDVGLGVVIP